MSESDQARAIRVSSPVKPFWPGMRRAMTANCRAVGEGVHEKAGYRIHTLQLKPNCRWTDSRPAICACGRRSDGDRDQSRTLRLRSWGDGTAVFPQGCSCRGKSKLHQGILFGEPHCPMSWGGSGSKFPDEGQVQVVQKSSPGPSVVGLPSRIHNGDAECPAARHRMLLREKSNRVINVKHAE